RALGCEGMARVDFFLRPDASLVLNEINTIPGFTNISMYAKALAADGMPYDKLIEALIEHALKRHAARD
ncbi:D-alanine--D-alanine ligase A, partial [Rhizobiaceae sp. 2RAB30]